MEKISQEKMCEACLLVARTINESYKATTPEFRRKRVKGSIEAVAERMGCGIQCRVRLSGNVGRNQ